MTPIKSANFEAMPRVAQRMRELGQDMGDEIAKIYQSITDLHNSWRGEQYNKLAESFNTKIPNFRHVLVVVIGQIPSALDQIANNYSGWDKESKVTNAEMQTPKEILAIPIRTDIGMPFDWDEVEKVKTNVSGYCRHVEAIMNDIESVFTNFADAPGDEGWVSQASHDYKELLFKCKTDIIKAFDELDASFVTYMNEAASSAEKVEKSNDVNSGN